MASSQIEYWITSDNVITYPASPDKDPTSGKSAGVIDHGIVLTGLNPETTYNYKVKSKDAAGNEAISEAKTFTTLAIPEE